MANQEIAALRELFSKNGLGRTLSEHRLGFDGLGKLFRVASDVKLEPVVAEGVPGEWTITPGVEGNRVLLYLHGGGYGLGSTESHRHLASEVGRAADSRVLTINYRLAPEAPFPAAVDDALAAYRYLLGQEFSPQDISIVGDSAGGGLAIALLLAAREAGLPQPSCVVCISPWCDLTLSGATMDSKAAEDQLAPKPMLVDLVEAYLGGADARHPWISPIFADLKGISPLFILVGSAETLLDDAVRLAGAAGAAEVPVRLEIWPEMIHVWPLFHTMLTEGRQALASIADFIAECQGKTPLRRMSPVTKATPRQ